jgi:hypothetical protein
MRRIAKEIPYLYIKHWRAAKCYLALLHNKISLPLLAIAAVSSRRYGEANS